MKLMTFDQTKKRLRARFRPRCGHFTSIFAETPKGMVYYSDVCEEVEEGEFVPYTKEEPM